MNVTAINSKASVETAIAAASRKTGIDFNYLVGQAQVESGMRPNARAVTSSATGLYQFIDQSWLSVIKSHGGEHGLGWAANSIQQNGDGRFTVGDPAMRRAILDLRKDPRTAAIMAAEHASDNKAALEERLGRPANGTDLYMAHFLGQKGAGKFLNAMQERPDRIGAAMFPAAARANRAIFYAPGGQPRTLSDIYNRFANKLAEGAKAAGAQPADLGPAMEGMSGTFGANEVILGNGAVDRDRHWVETTLAQLGVDDAGSDRFPSGQQIAAAHPMRGNNFLTVDPMRPTPETARLAYLMLAKLGA